jgi:hypothetical protein
MNKKRKKRLGKESKSMEINESCNIDADWRMFNFFLREPVRILESINVKELNLRKLKSD